MSDDNNIVSQDEIDNLLAEMEEEGEQQEKPESEEGKEEASTDPAAWGLSEEELSEDEKAAAEEETAEKQPPAKDVDFKEFSSQQRPEGVPRSLDFVLDIPLILTVEVGRTKMNIGDLLTLGPGSIIELTKMAGEPLEVFVNDKLVARGEAVIVNEKFGIRLTDVISKAERIENLNQ